MKSSDWPTERLQAIYDYYNARVWGGRLPQYAVSCGSLVAGMTGYCSRRRGVIVLDLRKIRNARELRSIICHELVHVIAPLGHGYSFWKEFVRVPTRVFCDDFESVTWSKLRSRRWFHRAARRHLVQFKKWRWHPEPGNISEAWRKLAFARATWRGRGSDPKWVSD